MKLRYALYTLLIILLNVAATTLFFRVDLTENNSYSLSQASKNLVKNLEEPLTIKVFLSEKLPVPYNTLERDIRDILTEYQFKANKNFNYTIDLIKKDGGNSVDPSTYGINPVNIQSIEQDEMKVVSAYIGMTFIHGDLTKTIPVIQYNQNLELTITDTIRKLTEKTTSLLGLEKNIQATLYLSPILYDLSPELREYSNNLNRLISGLNSDYFNRITLSTVVTKDSDIKELENKYHITTLNLDDGSGNIMDAVASIIIEGNNEPIILDIISQDIFGRTIIKTPTDLEIDIRSSIDKIIGAGTRIGYLTSNGTIPMDQNPNMFSQQQEPGINGLKSIINENYTLSVVDLKNGSISDDIKTLIIARPTENFSNRELFILDQYLLKGNSILLALEQFTMDMEQSNPNYGQEVYKKVDTGLIELLANYGITAESNMVSDKKSFKQVQRDNNGSIVETQVYFAPLISPDKINTTLPFLKGINELITFKAAEIKATNPEDESIKSLYNSSENSWITKIEDISLNPNSIRPKEMVSSYSLGVIKEGGFTSYFKDKDIPAKEFKEVTEEDETNANTIVGVDGSENLITSSNNGKIVILGSGDMLTDSIIGKNYPGNVLLVQNIIDYLSGRGDYTLMRSKGVATRSMTETTSTQRNIIKYFNIIGLPILVGIIGLLAYLMWLNRKKQIKAIFIGESDEK